MILYFVSIFQEVMSCMRYKFHFFYHTPIIVFSYGEPFSNCLLMFWKIKKFWTNKRFKRYITEYSNLWMHLWRSSLRERYRFSACNFIKWKECKLFHQHYHSSWFRKQYCFVINLIINFINVNFIMLNFSQRGTVFIPLILKIAS